MEFLFGVITGAVAMLAVGFFREAGKDLYSFFKKKKYPGKPEPKLVDSQFVPDDSAGSDLHWVSEAKMYAFEKKGYMVYEDSSGHQYFHVNAAKAREFLMVRNA